MPRSRRDEKQEELVDNSPKSIPVLKKMDASKIVGNVKDFVTRHCENDKDKVDAYTLYGTASGVKTGEGAYGPWIAFLGDFEAVNSQTGETFRSVKVFVPEPLSTLFANAMTVNEIIEFAYKVSIIRDDSMPHGYEYNVTPLTEVKQSDALAHLRALALEAPTA